MGYLHILWKQWRTIARKIGHIQSLIIFTAFYFLILWPVGSIFSLRKDPLRRKKKTRKSNFVPWNHPTDTLIQAKKPY